MDDEHWQYTIYLSTDGKHTVVANTMAKEMLGDVLEDIMPIYDRILEKYGGRGSTTDKLQTSTHYCDKHATSFKRHEKAGEVWWSHQYTDDEGNKKWCNEKVDK